MKIKDYIEFFKLPQALGRGLTGGKRYYNAILRDIPAFGKYTGNYIQRQILHACTEYAVSRELSGIPGIELREASNRGNYTFLEILTPSFNMTTSLVRKRNAVPRSAIFRCVRAMSNQPCLFPEQEADRPVGKPYFILVHGLNTHIDELFGGIGMPCADDPTRWNDFILLDDYIEPTTKIPDEPIDDTDPGFILIKKNFLGDDNDSA